MNIITQNDRELLEYDINYNRNESRESMLKADQMLRLRHYVMGHVHALAEIVAWTRPTVLPMNWTSIGHKERLLWVPAPLGRALPTVTLPLTSVVWGYSQIMRSRDNVPQEITRSYVSIGFISEPSWQTFKRWSSVIIDDFYRAMRAVRESCNVEWKDESKTKTEYSWDNVKMRYCSRKPLWKIKLPINETPDIYDSSVIHTHCEVDVRVTFTLEIPTPPEQERDGNGCHIVEEVVTETTTKKIRMLKCV